MPWDHRVRRRLKLRELNILLAVAQAGSMAKAAKELAISQPAVSKAISDMEHTLGVVLFDRSQQGVELTQYGRALVKRGVAVFDELQQGVQDIDFLADPEAGELHIGSSSGLSEGIVLAVIDRMARQHPRVVFHVVPGGLLLQFEELRERRVELAFARLFGATPKGEMDAQVLYDEPLVVAVGIENPWARRRKISLEELVKEPWTWPAAGTTIDSLIVEAFRTSGLKPPRAKVYADAINMRTRLAATGPYLAVVPASIFSIPGKHKTLIKLPVELPSTQQQIAILTLRNRTLSPLAQLFIDCAREVAKPFAKGQTPTVRAKNGDVSARRSQIT
jgi:molybdate transport repressor ModE-like protein